jgi:hypothetical protein
MCPWSNPTTNNPAANTIANARIANFDTPFFETLSCLVSDMKIINL